MSHEAVAHVSLFSPFTGADLLVHYAVADTCNDLHGYEFYGSIGYLSHKARVNEKTTRRALIKMVNEGHLVKLEENRGKPNRYRFEFNKAYYHGKNPADQEKVHGHIASGSLLKRAVTDDF